MKTILTTLILLCLLASQSFSQWEWLNPRPHGNSNNRIAFGSSSIDYTLVGNAGIIMKTTNDGVDWEIQNSGTDVNLNDIYISGQDGIAVGNGGTILRTIDGGDTWNPKISGTTTNLTAVAFATPSTGIITGWDGRIRRTTDGGLSWSAVALDTTQRLYGVSFADASNGIAVGDNGLVFRTTNAGFTWISQTSGTVQSLYDVSYVSSTTAVAAGWGGTIIRTTNGGSTWNFIGYPDIIRWGVSFIDSDNGVVAGDLNTLVRTTDAGITWEQAAVGTMATNFHCVRFYNSTKGVAVGEWGAIFKTTDGGITWQIITKGSLPQGGNPDAVNRNNLYSVQCIGSNRAVISGSSEVFITNNTGVSWTSVAMNGHPVLNDLDFANQNIGAMIGKDANAQGAIIFRTTNAGSDWFIQYNNNSVTLNSIDLSTPTHGIAVGNAGKILRTTNGGQNWTDHSITANNLYDVFLVDSLIGYTVARYGFIFKTTNGGVTWDSLTSNFSHNLYGVAFSDANNGIAVGDSIRIGVPYGLILKTVDGGVTWSKQVFDSPLSFNDVTFTDIDNWYAVGTSSVGTQPVSYLGRIFKSTNAGINWSEQQLPIKTTRFILGISAFNNSTLLTVGLEGMVLRTTNSGVNFVEEVATDIIPTDFALFQNYPNPFNPSTVISWQTPTGSNHSLKIYDLLGNEIATLVDEFLPAGNYKVNFNADGLSSGIYFYKLQAGSFIETKKMLMIK